MSTLFLTAEEVAELTGIKTGKHGKSRSQLQCEHLRKLGVAFYPNAAGEPKIVRSALEGRRDPTPETKQGWTPSVLKKVA